MCMCRDPESKVFCCAGTNKELEMGWKAIQRKGRVLYSARRSPNAGLNDEDVVNDSSPWGYGRSQEREIKKHRFPYAVHEDSIVANDMHYLVVGIVCTRSNAW